MKDFGRVPAYLQQRSEAERRAREEYENFVKAEREQRAMKHMTEEERQAILKVNKCRGTMLDLTI